MNSTPVIVAIDGPAGAGKSTIARALASRLGLEYLDTGAMYRAVTHAAMDRSVALDDTEAVAALARSISIRVADGKTSVDDIDVSEPIRGGAVTAAVSTVAANSAVRRSMRDLQRAWGLSRGGGVIEGRDIGTVVFPDALLKVYLTASPRVRAERRVAEVGGDVDAMERSIMERDHKDSSRSDSPLSTSSDSVVIDTGGRTVDAIVDEIVAMIAPRRTARRS
ncbi:MAG: (d)CMP kinase [Ilumatobacteraceae bacterium]|jgi:cytidylate kinase|nr:(d)CMP kinase [Ilumatobacteraceae bacterium]